MGGRNRGRSMWLRYERRWGNEGERQQGCYRAAPMTRKLSSPHQIRQIWCLSMSMSLRTQMGGRHENLESSSHPGKQGDNVVGWIRLWHQTNPGLDRSALLRLQRASGKAMSHVSRKLALFLEIWIQSQIWSWTFLDLNLFWESNQYSATAYLEVGEDSFR